MTNISIIMQESICENEPTNNFMPAHDYDSFFINFFRARLAPQLSAHHFQLQENSLPSFFPMAS